MAHPLAAAPKNQTLLSDLTQEQQAVVETWGKGQAVLAGAGSGKTTTLVLKCEALVKRNPQARFVAVSFTEKSASELREKLSGRGLLDEDAGRHWITTIHGLCSSILREFPRLAGLDGEESVLTQPEAETLWKQSSHSLWFGELQPNILESLEILLERESRAGLVSLLGRVKSLHGFGVLDRLEKDRDSLALHRVATYVLERYEGFKRRRGSLDFDDLEKAADRILENATARKIFHDRFDLVMVDEFQDTNPVQARILWNFMRPDKSNTCVVGDPKQSIYRFRDADVTVFEEYCQRLPIRQSLTWNFRSRPAIIDFVNRVCEPLFQASELPYENLVPKREATSEVTPILRLDLDEPARLVSWVRSEQAKGVSLGDIAIVLRKIRGNEKWLRPLIVARIPLAIGSGGFFWEDPRVRECVAALSWWDQPANSLSAAAFLRAPWMEIADAELDRWVATDSTFLKPFFASDHPVAHLLLPHRSQHLSPGDFLLKLLEYPAAERELGIALLSLWHRAEELSLAGFGFHQVVREFRDCVSGARKESDVPPPETSGEIRVMTVHGSKGLEFPIVVMADFSGPWRGRGMPLLFWDREKGAYLGKRDEEGERSYKDDPTELIFRSEEKRKELCESKRLFYVALTRARERLVFAFPSIEVKESKPQKSDPLLVDHWRGWIERLGGELPFERFAKEERSEKQEEREEPEEIDHPDVETTEKKAPTRITLRRPRHSVTEWTVLSRCPRAYDWTYVRPQKPETGFVKVDRDPDLRELDARELGTAIHSVLERAEFLGEDDWMTELLALEKLAGSVRVSARAIAEWLRGSPWMMKAEGVRSWRELGFEVPVAGARPLEPAVLIGSIDRLVFDIGRGDYTLLDFKVTGRIKEPDELRRNYSLQLALYVWALGRLEPASRGRTRAVLLNLHPKGVQEVEIPLPTWVNDLNAGDLFLRHLSETADQILNSIGAAPRSGEYCERCRFKRLCGETPH